MWHVTLAGRSAAYVVLTVLTLGGRGGVCGILP